MPTTIAIRFPLGRYHATPWGHNVNEGAVDWPPEPWRLLRALLATAHNRCPELAEAEVLDVLAQLVDPPIYQVPPYQFAHTRHYLPDKDHRSGARGHTDKVFDTFAVCDPGDELLVIWPNDLDEHQRSVLATMCERLPYLGRAESLCEARLLDGTPEPVSRHRGEPWTADAPSSHQPVELLAPANPLDPSALTQRTTEVRKAKRVDPPSTRRLRYRVPPPEPLESGPSSRRPARPAPTAVRYHIVAAAPPSRYDTVAITDALRTAALSWYGKHNGGGRSATLAGKDEHGNKLTDDHRHAHYLAFVADPDRTRTGLLDTLVVWASGGLDQPEVNALIAISELRSRPGLRGCRLGVEGVGDISHVAPELIGPSTHWRTATPMALGRRRPRSVAEDDFVHDEVTRALTHTGHGAPPIETLDITRDGTLPFRRHRLREHLHQARRACHVRIAFGEEATGPVVLGALNHFGLGLLQPDR